PEPMLDLTRASKEARERLWQYRERSDVKRAIHAILKKHVAITPSVRKSKKQSGK
ncbi:deoxyribodipyrimidine photolyase, partial [Pseudoalteromonas sp. S1609]